MDLFVTAILDSQKCLLRSSENGTRFYVYHEHYFPSIKFNYRSYIKKFIKNIKDYF